MSLPLKDSCSNLLSGLGRPVTASLPQEEEEAPGPGLKAGGLCQTQAGTRVGLVQDMQRSRGRKGHSAFK